MRAIAEDARPAAAAPPPRSVLRRLLAAPALGLAATVASAAALVARFKDADIWQRLDFTIYHQALTALAHGQDLYAYRQRDTGLGFTYPPFAALALIPLTWLQENTAALVWLVATVVLSAVFCRVFLGLVPQGALPVGPWLVTAGLLWSVPVYLTLRIGQVNALVSLLVLADAVLALRGRRQVGWLAGAAAAIKLTPLALVVFLLGLRRTDAAARLVASFALCTGVAALWRPQLSREYWGGVLFQTGRVGTLDSGYNNSLWRLTSTAPLPHPATLVLGVLVALAVCAATLVATAWAAGSDRPLLAAGVGCVALHLLSPITWSHHLYFLLLLPFAAVADPALRSHPVVGAALTVVSLAAVVELGDLQQVGQDTTLCVVRAAVMLAAVLGAGAVGAGALLAHRRAGPAALPTPTHA